MKIIDNIKRQRVDRIKNNIRKSTARYYIKKHSKEILQLQEIYNLNLSVEKKSLSQYYEDRIKSLNDKIVMIENDIKWYKQQYNRYIDLKEELEKVSGTIDIDNLHNEVNRVFVMLNSAKDKVAIIQSKHNKRNIIGIK